MGLRGELQALASEVLDAFDDVVVEAVLTRPSRPRRDASGAINDEPQTYTTRCVLATAGRTDPITGLMLNYDATALIPAAELATVPRPEDRMLINGTVWIVADNGVSTDEAEAVHTCRLRRKSL